MYVFVALTFVIFVFHPVRLGWSAEYDKRRGIAKFVDMNALLVMTDLVYTSLPRGTFITSARVDYALRREHFNTLI